MKYICTYCRSSSPQTAKICGACKLEPYCSRQCQKADWPIHKQICTTALSRDSIFKQIRKLRYDTNFLGAIACILISAPERNHVARNSSLYAVEVVLDTIPLTDSSTVGTQKRLLQLVETNIVPNPKELDANATEIMRKNPPLSPSRLVCVILRSQHCMRAAVMYCQSVTSEMMSLNIPGTTPTDHMDWFNHRAVQDQDLRRTLTIGEDPK